jgi:glycine/D-amino acid oxidase-like deaminating enzyme
MQIAIIGRGFAGLALAYYLSEFPHTQVYLFDQAPLGISASGTACGLLHPFSGAKSRKTWMADVGMQTTKELIEIVENFLNEKICIREGITRPATNADQLKDYKLALSKYSDLLWLDEKESVEKIPFINCQGSLFIPNGISLFVNDYLLGLYQICLEKKVCFVEKKITTLKELENFDAIVAATGSDTLTIEELKTLPLRKTKGQILKLSWPLNLPQLQSAIVSHVYMSKAKNPSEFYLGATYERSPVPPGVDLESAKALLLPKAYELIDDLKKSDILECKAGFRMFSPDNITPIAGKTAYKNTWIFSGLGSKGLLHHAWIAKALSRAIVNDDYQQLPKELYFRLLK